MRMADGRQGLGRLQLNFLSWFKNCRIVIKLRLAFVSLACIAVLVGAAALVAMSALAGRVITAYEQDLPAVSAVKEAGIGQLKAMRVLLRVVLAAGDTDEIDKQKRDLVADVAMERAQLKLCNLKVRSTEGRAQLAAVEKLLPKFEKGAADIVTAAKAGDVIGFRTTILDLIPLTDQIQSSLDRVSQITQGEATKSKNLATLTYSGALIAMLPTILAAALVAAMLSFIMSNLIAKPLSRIVRVLEATAAGDLTQTLPVHSADEMGQVAAGLNTALESIRQTLRQVSVSANDLKVTSQTLAATASSLAEGTETQAANLQTTTSSLEQISATIRNNAASTSRANELGLSARTAAEKGDQAVLSAVAAMEEIRASADEISNILGAINELAFQSNLLAINASIEAARAGESGRSFVVVANEMRFLADKSRESAKLIEGLISKSVERVNNGSQLVNESGAALAEITRSVKTLSAIVQEIDTASNEQNKGVDHVARAMNRVDTVVQDNSAKTQSLSGAAQQLAGLALGLNQTLTHFCFESNSSGDESNTPVPDDLAESLGAVKGWAQSCVQRVRKSA